MKTISTMLTTVALSIGLFTATSANATLIDQGSTVYDNDLGISWLKNANVNGLMTWYGAQSWISSLNTASYLGYNDWRLPTSDTCFGYDCTGSEMGHLFYNELGGSAGFSIATTHNANYNLFSNLQSYYYWSGTEYAPNINDAWSFYFNYGIQYSNDKDGSMYALAVRPGQVSAVPEPGSAWLFGIGLLGLLGVARRRLALR